MAKPTVKSIYEGIRSLAKLLGDGQEGLSKIEDASQLATKFPELAQASTNVTQAGLLGVGMAQFLNPPVAVTIAALAFLIKQFDAKKKDKEDMRLKEGAEKLATYYDEIRAKVQAEHFKTFGLPEAVTDNFVELLVQLSNKNTDVVLTDVQAAKDENAAELSVYFGLLNDFLKDKFQDQAEELRQVKTETSLVLQELSGLQEKVELILNEATQSHITLDLKRPKALTDRNRLLFTQQSTPFIGRAEELKQLHDFCDHKDPFRFWIVAGPGGVGKSRMALQLCYDMFLEGWQVGFLSSLNSTDWSRWEPKQDTLIVVDYFFVRTEPWSNILDSLTRLKVGYKVRILFVERTADADAWERHLPGDALRDHFHGTWDTVDGRPFLECLNVGGLDEDALKSILLDRVRQHPDWEAPRILARYMQIDPVGRPLFAMLAADAFEGLGSVPEWNLDTLMSRVLERVFDKWVPSQGPRPVDEAHANLLLLSTFVGGLNLSPTNYRELQERFHEWLGSKQESSLVRWPQQLDDEACALLASYSDDWYPDDRRMPPMLPDPLGEAMALAFLRGDFGARFGHRADGSASSHVILEFAGKLCDDGKLVRSKGLDDFVRRLCQDFPDGIGALSGLRKLKLKGLMFKEGEVIEIPATVQSLTFQACHIPNPDLISWPSELKSLIVDRSVPEVLSFASSFSRLKHLSMPSYFEGSLAQLELLGDLESFTLIEGLPDSIEPMKHLERLVSLRLTGTQIRDLSPIASLRRLRNLDLTNSGIDDIEHLRNLTNLTLIVLSSNPVSDISALQELHDLSYLDLDVTLVTDLSSLKGLHQLETLNLSSLQIDGFEVLRNLTKLRTLHLRYSTLKEPESLACLESLENLSLANSDITSIEWISGLTNLKDLTLDYTKVCDLEPLTELHSLEALTIAGTPVIDLTPIRGLKNMRYVCLSGFKTWYPQDELPPSEYCYFG